MKTIHAGDRLIINIQVCNLHLSREGRVDKTLEVNELEIGKILHELADKIVAGDVKLIEEAPT